MRKWHQIAGGSKHRTPAIYEMSYTRVDKPAALTHAASTQIRVGASADSGAGGAVALSDPVGLGQA